MNGPTWNIESIYPSISSHEFQNDWTLITGKLESLQKSIAHLKGDLAKPTDKTVTEIQNILLAYEDCVITAATMSTYLSCSLSVDSANNEAKTKESEIQIFFSKLSQAMVPVNLMIQRCDDSIFNKILSHDHIKTYRFMYEEQRKKAAHTLSEAEETLARSLEVPGHTAWGNLYDELSGNLRVQLNYPDRTEIVGLAKASALTKTANELDRKVAWLGIQEAWSEHQHTAAAIVNALAGWRIEDAQKRSHTKPMSFMNNPLSDNRITQKTLDAMIMACRNNAKDIQKAGHLMAKVMKKDKLELWDLLAPSPIGASQDAVPFEKGAQIVKDSFANVSPEMADFVQMMVDKKWIEGRVLPNKRTGAYCTGFLSKREPRVYMTYMGSNSDIGTLAHELGHGYHSWVMRDMTLGEMEYPMTLAETASVFAETVLGDALMTHAKTREEKIENAWGDLEGAMAFLINIPVRYEFERKFYEARKERTLSASELRKLMTDVWTEWYGDCTDKADELFWAHKLHFHIAGLSFYNFPYTFGYLFSLSIYARRKELGAEFMPKYKAILRDTGRMTAEDLIMKHLGEDITQPAFWQKSIEVVKAKINHFESLLSN
ncbi:M3 family oligoendopeptidase [Bdellovibrio sp. SKB1291214]|uniref:M3 family oligoendopeptidase n=1 Tax=Bdellovibrio sp. SKB1291214 TaxID=1732569 RepID=UPI000B518440|nr:M3 family oligoendopeptidase [Bdellovibrio sp. SKB1291214]UYL07275.1 M3 family oligoendopeptidase [Bdellovibrio sp. SKB1291214]